MGLIDKIQQSAKNISASMTKSANRSGGQGFEDNSQESEEFTFIKSQIETINHELNDAYNRIGRKIISHVIKNRTVVGIDVSDILYIIEPKLQKKDELEKEFIKLEKENIQNDIAAEKELAEEKYFAEKANLDRELAMSALSKKEYDEKLELARKRIDNFEEIHCIEKEERLGFITTEEKNAKIALLIS
ncbi:MAG: hypothetical protein MJ100_00655 [Ruminococcus sp.]|nr:hypothetical protein [Ruminococcus sp.]